MRDVDIMTDDEMVEKLRAMCKELGLSPIATGIIIMAAGAATKEITVDVLGKIEDDDDSDRCILDPRQKACVGCGRCEDVGFLLPCYDENYSFHERFFQAYNPSAEKWAIIDKERGRVVNNVDEKVAWMPVYPDDFDDYTKDGTT